jgi:transcriptional regulator with XRE-family HTH domain
MDSKDIGLKIKYIRQSQGLTQKDLAEKIGTTWEMVSRYETGKSSPLGRIDKIADALNTNIAKLLADNIIAQEEASYTSNVIPLINKSFRDIHKVLKETKVYYNAPSWIMQKYLQPFCVDTSIIEIQTTQIGKNGILFAVQEKPEISNDIVIARQSSGNLIAATQQNLKTKQKPIATVIAWEKRFR